MKLGLGTVQFGLDYGVSNRAGRTPEAETGRILRLAADSGIRVLDTAAGYGKSEEVLGRTLPAEHPFHIVTKTPALRAGEDGREFVDRVRASIRLSLSRLSQEKLYGVMVHRAEDLLSIQGDRLMKTLLEFRQMGVVEKVGVSVYSGEQIDAILARHPVELVQLPVSVLDQRLIGSGHVAKLKRAGIEIHARSAFLQGLLFMSPDELPAYFSPIRDHLAEYRACIESLGLTPLQAALGPVLAQPELDHVILGVNIVGQLQEILAAQAVQVDAGSLARFALTDSAMLDPSRWRL
ncbi:MAG: aldo/keto reductase [Rhodocyclales bacterium]|nr:aldo/keto reductase [Rhodocyclales bacterium]